MLLKSLAKLGLLASATPLLLSACSFDEPGPMATGYAHHQGIYKTIPGAEPKDLGFDYSRSLSVESAEHWRVATRDLTLKAALDAGIAGAPVYIQRPERETPLTRAMDNYLREALVNIGIGLLSQPGGGPTIRYDAALYEPEEDRQVFSATDDTAKLVPPSPEEHYDALTSPDHMVLFEPLTPTALAEQPPAPQEKFVPPAPEPLPGSVVMTIQVVDGGMLLAHESGVYRIPEAADYHYMRSSIDFPPVTGYREKNWPISGKSFESDDMPAPEETGD